MSIQFKYDLVLIGNIIVDNIYYISQWPDQGSSNQFLFHKMSIGGIGNIIDALSKESINIFAESIIGKNNNGKIIIKYLQKNNIKNKLYKSSLPTSNAIILSS